MRISLFDFMLTTFAKNDQNRSFASAELNLCLTKEHCIFLFFTHIYCTLQYIFGCASKSDIKKMRVLQKKAMRLITNSNYTLYNAYTKPILKNLKILPFENILYEQKMMFMHANITTMPALF